MQFTIFRNRTVLRIASAIQRQNGHFHILEIRPSHWTKTGSTSNYRQSVLQHLETTTTAAAAASITTEDFKNLAFVKPLTRPITFALDDL